MLVEEYKNNIAHYAREIRSTRPLDSTPPVRMPFDRSVKERCQKIESNEVDIADEFMKNLLQFLTPTVIPSNLNHCYLKN